MVPLVGGQSARTLSQGQPERLACFAVMRKALHQSSHHCMLDGYRVDEITGSVGVASDPCRI